VDYIGLSKAEFFQVHNAYSEHPAFEQAKIQQEIKSSKLPTISR